MAVNGLIKLKESTLPYLHLYYVELLSAIFLSSFGYLFYNLIPIHIFIAGVLLLGSGLFLLKVKWESTVKRGILRLCPKTLRLLLLEKSLLDLWSDLVYFPLITKIIGAFIRSAVAKPPPQQMHQHFRELPKGFQTIFTTKGLLHLAPSRIQQLCLKGPEFPEQIPVNYGKSCTDWYSRQIYEKCPIKVHQQSVIDLILARIDNKIKWPYVIIVMTLLAIGLRKMDAQKMKKSLINSSVFIGAITAMIMVLIKIKRIGKKQPISIQIAKEEQE